MDELTTTAAVLAEGQRDTEIGADLRWLRDTLARVQVRYGRALAALATVPAFVAEVNRWQVPEAAWNEAGALNAAVRRALDELERVSEYLDAVLDPGPVSCRTCGERVAVFSTEARGWQHYRTEADPKALGGQRFELLGVDHHPDLVFGRPDYPVWQDPELDAATNGGEPV